MTWTSGRFDWVERGAVLSRRRGLGRNREAGRADGALRDHRPGPVLGDVRGVGRRVVGGLHASAIRRRPCQPLPAGAWSSAARRGLSHLRALWERRAPGQPRGPGPQGRRPRPPANRCETSASCASFSSRNAGKRAASRAKSRGGCCSRLVGPSTPPPQMAWRLLTDRPAAVPSDPPPMGSPLRPTDGCCWPRSRGSWGFKARRTARGG